MNASWPMVIGALFAGTVGGFMIPVRPEIRDVPAISASKATEPAKKSAANEGPDEVRQIPLTAAAATGTETKPVAASEPAEPKQEAAVTPKPEPVKPQQKTVTAPPAHEERPAQAEQASTRPDEPRAQTAAEPAKKAAERPRRSTRRVNRDALDDGIPTRIYLRGPDGRLYLAPEYSPSGRTVYYMR